MKYQKTIIFSFIFIFLLVNSTSAVTVTCGSPVNPGDYNFPNRDSNPVKVFINTAGTSISATPNNFIIPVGQSQLVQLRAPGDTYARLFVTYTDTVNGFSASLECHMFASSGTASTTTTIPGGTTTTVPTSCSGYNNQASCVAAGCTWIVIGGTGYCTGSSSSTTTTVPQTTTTTAPPTTTTQQTTTTIQSSCSGKSYQICLATSGCEWVGNPITGYCRSKQSTTTTISQQTTTTIVQTTTTVAQTNSDSSGGGGSSGGSSGGSGGSSGGSSTSKPTGFYNFPSFVQVPANGKKTIQGNFYAAKDLSNIKFTIKGLDSNWFTISPSSVQKINKSQTVNITITFNIPENAKQDSYIFKISTEAGTLYEKPITLAITERVEEVESTTTTTVQENKPTKPTGFFVNVTDFVKAYWFALALPVIVVGAWFLLPSLKTKSKGIVYSIEHEDEQNYDHNYLEVKYKEPTVEVKPQPIKTRDIRDDIKRKVIKEIRERALKSERRR